MAESNVQRRPTRSTLRRVTQAIDAVDNSVVTSTVARVKEILAARPPFDGSVEIRLDEQHSFVVDGANVLTEPSGKTADCRFYMHPRNLLRMAKGEMDPRQAILFGQMQVEDGHIRVAVRFGDHLAGREVKLRLESNRELPKPTRDWDKARDDLETFGYALVEGALSPEEVKALRTRVREQAAGEREAGVATLGEATQTVWSLLNKGRVFHDLLLNPLIEAFVPERLGEHPVLTGIVSQIAMPGNTSSTMHLDQSYVQPAVKDFPIGVNILWFMDDVSEANGGTRVMPGSHKNNIAPNDPYDVEGTVAAAGPAGTALLLDSRVWHSVGHNKTDRSRHLVVTYFNRSFMRTQENYFLSLRPEVEASLDDKVRIMCGFRCTGSLGAVEGPIEGKMNSRPKNPVGILKPKQESPVA